MCAQRKSLEADPAAGEVLELDGHEVRITHAERVLWPRAAFTKRRLVDYLLAIAPALLPHLRGRGITLRRFPEGVDGPGWFQAECRGCPEWMRTFDVLGRNGRTWRYSMVESVAALAWTANLGTLELHPFLSTIDRPGEPTALVLDLDPGPPAGLLACARVALLLRDWLASRRLQAYPKTSGSVGLHLYVPLAAGHSFAQAKAFARSLAAEMAAAHPALVTDVIDRSRRAGLVYLDWIQNDASRSTVAPYSLRATPWPLVSTPLTWEELEETLESRSPQSLVFTPGEVLARVERLGDLFAPLGDVSSGGVLPPEPTRG